MPESESPDFRKLGDRYADAILGPESPERAALRELRETLTGVERQLTMIAQLAQDIELVEDFNLNKAKTIAREIYNVAYPGKARALLAALDAEEGGEDA